MSDDRRERYAAALYEDANSGFRWVDSLASEISNCGWRDLADAAMAVADEEQHGQRENLESAEAEIREQDNEIARLQEQVRDLMADRARLRGELQRKTAAYDELAEVATNTVARLRSELESINAALIDAGNEYPLSVRGVRDVVSQREGHKERAEEAEAAIERVRAVLDSDPGWSRPGLERRVRAALEGDSA